MKAIIVLEDGLSFTGESFGAEGEVVGEAVFNTQVFGYQEILTDPAYRKQLIVMGYPHIGNAGINDNSFESDFPQASALIVKEYSQIYSNWQANGSLGDYMKKNRIIGISGVDTRALTIHIRDNGEMCGVVSTKSFDGRALCAKARGWEAGNLTEEVRLQSAAHEAKEQARNNTKTSIINLGINRSTMNRYPGAKIVDCDTTAEKILAGEPEQLVISSGPGDPTKLTGLVGEVKKLISKVPIYGIQNGACILAMALGCSVKRMKVGHHGVNQPVVDPKTGQGEISVQNHSYGVDRISDNVRVIHVNLNDRSVEKFQSRDGSCVGTLYFPIDERGKLAPGYQYV